VGAVGLCQELAASGRLPDWIACLSQDAKHGSIWGHHPCWRFCCSVWCQWPLSQDDSYSSTFCLKWWCCWSRCNALCWYCAPPLQNYPADPMFLASSLVEFPCWPMYTLPHSQGIRYTPGTVKPKSSLTWAYVWLLPWNMNRPDVEFCQEPPNFVGVTFAVWESGYLDWFSFFNFGFCFRCRAVLIWSLLYLFCWKVHFRWWISASRLPVSQSVLACRTNAVSTACFCAGWWSDLACSYSSIWVDFPYTKCPLWPIRSPTHQDIQER
jgi:hypothetical protein